MNKYKQKDVVNLNIKDNLDYLIMQIIELIDFEYFQKQIRKD